jgi:hypothetical protein
MPSIPRRLPVALAAIALSSLLCATTAFADTKESSTGIQFKDALSPAGAAGSLSLLGVGVRTKTFLKVKVYAAGLYADTSALKAVLTPYRGKPAGDLAKDAEVRKLMLGDGFEKSIRLVMARDVDGEDMAEAFSESVEPRVARQGAAAVRALATFKGYFKMDEVKEGSDLIFTWGKGGKLTTAIAGRTMGTIDSEPFCRALYEVFLGSGAVSPALKSSVYKGVERALAP